MYDAIVVGARCAGSPTAMLLARSGHRVLLVDKATFPSDVISTLIVWHTGVSRLKRWGLLEPLLDTKPTTWSKVSLDLGAFTLAGSPPAADGVTFAVTPRRTILDKLLLEGAASAGAEVRQGFTVEEFLREDGRVVGVRGRSEGGAAVTERARIVIGADGMHSKLARVVDAPKYNEKPPQAICYYGYWSGIPCEHMELFSQDARFVMMVPTHDGLTVVAVLWPHAEVDAFRSDVEGSYRKTIELFPALAGRAQKGKLEGRVLGMAELPNYYRKPYGPGWALVGDAGYHKDPITGQGMSDAFRDAELLARALGEGWSERRPLDEALADYERTRNEATAGMYEFTCQQAALEPPPPEMEALFSALRANPEQRDRFFGTVAGTVPMQEFFSEENMKAILSPPS